MSFDTSIMSQLNGTVSTPKSQTTGQGNINTDPTQLSDQFLTLLVAQMKNQDPLNPTENSEFTSQIAQINTVSGINDLNDTLNSITGQINTTQQLQASALVDKGVLVNGNQVAVGKDGETVTPFGVDLASDADNVRVTITDPGTGKVIDQYDLTESGPMQAGIQSFYWDGTNSAGEKVGQGNYTVSVEATSNGEEVSAAPLRYALVNGVARSEEGGAMLDLGPILGQASLSDIKQIL
ncbi:flagellar basal-body rod modification protein FlgD [Kushneria sinocarnis]|uniref:Basal-body rod modification protein FlgD n=1 Tax=Kushneria sinocarnis TaxID=595502 RepID=A0A420WXZ3_9GAMM|nr:flagellar hook assembly protein FlgD [Kushneria sinocarnis]RKR06082.1 flagellar basal-body rod modification protein FlgD [Kushneria sinocarnis]